MTGRSSCPDCGTILRIRDRSFVGRRVRCPECNATLQIETADDNGDFVTRRITASEVDHAEKGHGQRKSKQEKNASQLPAARSTFRRIFYSPLTAAWLLAIAVSALIAVLTLTPKIRFSPMRSVPLAAETASPTESILTTATPALTQMKEETSANQSVKVQPLAAIGDSGNVSPPEPVPAEGSLTLPDIPVLSDTARAPVVASPPAPAKIDVQSKMAQKFSRYSQPKVRRRDLLDALQEQLGAPIRFETQELGAASLEDTVTFELVNTTIGEVIKTVADAAGWEIVIEDTGIRLKRK